MSISVSCAAARPPTKRARRHDACTASPHDVTGAGASPPSRPIGETHVQTAQHPHRVGGDPSIATSAAAITNGQPDNGAHPYVGQLLFYVPGRTPRTRGSMIRAPGTTARARSSARRWSSPPATAPTQSASRASRPRPMAEAAQAAPTSEPTSVKLPTTPSFRQARPTGGMRTASATSTGRPHSTPIRTGSRPTARSRTPATTTTPSSSSTSAWSC